MKPLRRLLAVIAALGVSLSGCMTLRSHVTVGQPLDPARLAQIKPGQTTMGEVLAWLGPPEFIVEGAQTVLDSRSLASGYLIDPPHAWWTDPVRTRTLTAPAGTVLFVYQSISMDMHLDLAIPTGVAAGRGGIEIEPGDFLIFISKNDERVVDVASHSTSGGTD